jgi:DNA-binding NarL/FixJ family response regulator
MLQEQDGRGIPRRAFVELADPARPYAVTLSVRLRDDDRFAGLTAREQEVAELLAAGLSNKAIAAELVLSVGTVKDHVHRILRKSGLSSRAAVAAAWR